MRGIIFDIQRMSVHDGPGIRTTVFFKGCPLRCVWCHNPESKSGKRQLAFHPNLCIGCGMCVLACARGCHVLSKTDHRIDRSRCMSCGACVETCVGALELLGDQLTVENVMQVVRKDAAFYANSGGGITLSGGEPLAQPDFACALMEAARREGLHVCMETSGFAPSDVLLRAAEQVDLFLYDIKETDRARHKAFTGVDNALILKNLKALDAAGYPTVLRCPIIPGMNDRMEHFAGIAVLANQLKAVRMIHIEPYNRLGAAKSESIGVDYPLKELAAPTDEQVAQWIETVQAHTDVPVIKS